MCDKDIIIDVTPSATEVRVACPICPRIFLLSKVSGPNYSVWNFRRHYFEEHITTKNPPEACDELDVHMNGVDDSHHDDTESGRPTNADVEMGCSSASNSTDQNELERQCKYLEFLMRFQ